jgi:fumarate hydratase class I
MYDEKNTNTNLPAQIDLAACDGDQYQFLFVAKGGGSANKSYLYQETRAILNPQTLVQFLTAKMTSLGTAACPLITWYLSSGAHPLRPHSRQLSWPAAKYLDSLPATGSSGGRAFRDLELEAQLLQAARNCGIGAQFGGRYFALDVRVIRLPRHGASLPVGIGVSCSADRQAREKLRGTGYFWSSLKLNPSRFIPPELRDVRDETAVRIDLNRPMP